jgi:hypothetical protein
MGWKWFTYRDAAVQGAACEFSNNECSRQDCCRMIYVQMAGAGAGEGAARFAGCPQGEGLETGEPNRRPSLGRPKVCSAWRAENCFGISVEP